jgi:hypothetical protein
MPSLVLEEMPHGVPNVFDFADRKTTRGFAVCA